MIVIKTANGDRLINEYEVRSVNHNKEHAFVVITFRDGHSENAFQVESMYYTNKQDVELRDNGLMLAGAISDKEYFKALSDCYKRHLESLIDERDVLEREFIDAVEKPDSNTEWRKRKVEDIKNYRRERPGSSRQEIESYTGRDWYLERRKELKETGDKSEESFAKLTDKMKSLKQSKELYRDANDRIMRRNLWERIINKRVALGCASE